MTGNSVNQHVGLGNLSYDACVDKRVASTQRIARVTSTKVQVSQGEASLVDDDGTVDL